MNNVIFLDIDGVLNSNFWNDSHQKEISDGTLIDTEKIQLLAKLVRKTNSKIILHSGWKFWFDSNLQPTRKESENLSKLLQQEGLVIDGMTPDFSTEEIRKAKNSASSKPQKFWHGLPNTKKLTNG